MAAIEALKSEKADKEVSADCNVVDGLGLREIAIEGAAAADGHLGGLGSPEIACVRCVRGIFVRAGFRSTTCRSFWWQSEAARI